MKTSGTLLLGLIVFGGCSPTYYREWADRDVNRLLTERKEQTLGYEPQTVAPSTMPTTPPKSAYAYVPLTEPEPMVTPAIEPLRTTVPFAPLGPAEWFPPGTPAPQEFAPMSATAARAPGF